MNSVCIATYNGEKYIEEQLRSILVQLRPDDEVIVSDDGSTDNTLGAVKAIRDERVRILHSHCHDVKGNFVNALEHTQGDVIFLSDQDDVWLDGKYERCVKELEDVDLVCTNSMVTDENLNVTNANFFSMHHSRMGILKNILICSYYGSCMAFRRRVLDYALPMPSSPYIYHDIWLGLVAEVTGKVKFIDEPYLLYRRHDGTITQTAGIWGRSKRSLRDKVTTRIDLLWSVSKLALQYGGKK